MPVRFEKQTFLKFLLQNKLSMLSPLDPFVGIGEYWCGRQYSIYEKKLSTYHYIVFESGRGKVRLKMGYVVKKIRPKHTCEFKGELHVRLKHRSPYAFVVSPNLYICNIYGV